jgi:hypothetical protein
VGHVTYLGQLKEMHTKPYTENLKGRDQWLSSTNLRDSRIWKGLDKEGETKNALSFKRTGLKT